MTFWAFYLQEHANPVNRGLHLIGTTIAFALLVAAAALLQPWLLLAALLIGYAFAWVGHYFFEKNRPATFKAPLKSFASDWRMWGLWITGRLGRELQKHASNGS